MHLVPSDSAPELLEVRCPRCGAEPLRQEFYGPCASCIAELRATQALEASDAKLAEYVPKMNVVPNAIASKE